MFSDRDESAPAPFVHSLLGLRSGVPNFADVSSLQSCAIAQRILDLLDANHPGPTQGQTAGRQLEEGVRDHLEVALPDLDPRREWRVDRRSLITAFEQYQHLARLDALIESDDTDTLSVEIGRDYLVRPDVTVGLRSPRSSHWVLHAAISCKFTIRSDRVQNIRHEGVILTRHRRGRQPHIVTVTSEPMPSRLAAIARGTGEVDAVYHVCLPELMQAVDEVGGAEQRRVLDEIVSQGRLFDFMSLPAVLTI